MATGGAHVISVTSLLTYDLGTYEALQVLYFTLYIPTSMSL